MGSDILNMSWVNSKALLAGGEVDFFIRGYTDKKFMFLGHEVYLTTTHISMIIVMAFLLVFALFANHAIKKADPKEAPGPCLVFVYTYMQLIRIVRLKTADSGFWCDISARRYYMGDDSVQWI